MNCLITVTFYSHYGSRLLRGEVLRTSSQIGRSGGSGGFKRSKVSVIKAQSDGHAGTVHVHLGALMEMFM